MKTRVLFLAFGYSIHARRRIQIFVDDPSFEVAVVSTYDYAFERAQNYRLRANDRSPAVDWVYRRLGGPLALALLQELPAMALDLLTLERAVAQFRPQLVFLQTLLYPSYLAYALPRALPFMVTFWNGDVTWFAKWNGVERLLKKQLVTYGARRAAAITVNSEAARQACLDYGCQPERVHLIRYPGVDLQRFRPTDKAEARRELGLTTQPIVFCPRGLGEYLNSDVIVNAIAEVRRARPDVLFLFASGAGGAAALAEHQALARRLGVEHNCRWLGQIAWERMPLHYNASDVMVSMSSNDSLPNCMMEAMACAVPVVMGDIAPIREWITDGENGLLVDCRDSQALARALCRLLAEPETVARFTRRNRAAVDEKADGRKNNERLKRLVRSVATGATGTPA